MKRFEIFSALILLRLDYSTIRRYTEVTNTFLDCSLFQFFFFVIFLSERNHSGETHRRNSKRLESFEAASLCM